MWIEYGLRNIANSAISLQNIKKVSIHVCEAHPSLLSQKPQGRLEWRLTLPFRIVRILKDLAWTWLKEKCPYWKYSFMSLQIFERHLSLISREETLSNGIQGFCHHLRIQHKSPVLRTFVLFSAYVESTRLGVTFGQKHIRIVIQMAKIFK